VAIDELRHAVDSYELVARKLFSGL
jgi:hypothetical protein